MNPNLTSAVSEFSKGRTERSNKPSLRTLVQNLIARIRLWLGKLFSFSFARLLMIFFVGFSARVAWASHGGAARKAIPSWAPQPGLVAPAARPRRTSSRAPQAD